MTAPVPVVTVADVLARLAGVKRAGAGHVGRCPAHEDRQASLSIGTGRDGRVLLHCHAGCATEAVVAALGLDLRALMPPDPRPATTLGDLVASYDYVSEDGELLYQVCRFLPKTFRQRRPEGRGWSYRLGDVRRVPYRLPEVVAARAAGRVILVVEGEKDADRLATLGFVATTNAGGAGKWDPAWAALFAGAKVAILPDADEPGHAHAQQVAASLAPVAQWVRVVALPALPPKGDVSDWLDAGGTVAALKTHITAAPPWTPTPARTTSTGTTLAVVPPAPAAPPVVRAADLAREQVESAIQRGRRDLTNAPGWFSRDLTRLVGPMLPGDLWLVGALMGNGKTAFLLSQLHWLAEQGHGVLYLPLELDPEDVRRQWAAWSLGLDFRAVKRNAWHELPPGSQDRHEAEMVQLAVRYPRVQLPGDQQATLARLAWWVRWGLEQIDARVVVIDHFHRMDFGAAGSAYRVQVTQTIRAVKDLARAHGVTILASCQLNQDGDQLDRYHPPTIRRLKESAGLGEEADVVLMLSRRLRGVLSADDARAVRAGLASERDWEMPNTMTVTCRKHRLDDQARDRSALLAVEGGRVRDRVPEREVPSWAQ